MRLIILIFVAGLAAMPLIVPSGDVAIVVILAGLGIGLSGLLLLRRSPARPELEEEAGPTSDRRFLVRLFFAALLVRVFLAVVMQVLGLYTAIAPDELTFHSNGLMFSNWLKGESPYRLSLHHVDSLQVGYFYFVGGLYYLLGQARLVPVMFNCLAGALAVFPVYRVACELRGPEAGRPAALLVAFFPSLMLWSILLIRDAWVVLSLLWIISTVLELRISFTPLRVVRLILLLAVLGTLRQYLFLMVAMSAAASLLVGRAGRTWRSLAGGGLALVLILLLMKYAGFGLWELERASLHQLSLQRQYNSNVSDAAGSLRPEVDISEPIAAITYLPVGVMYFLGSPFPWEVVSSSQMLAVPDVILWYLLLPFVFMGLRHMLRYRLRDSTMLILCLLQITVLYALVEGNVGIIFRHRAQVIAPAMVLAGIGIAVLRQRRQEAREAEEAREASTPLVPRGVLAAHPPG